MDRNATALKAILEAFDIPRSAAASLGGVSQSFISRLLSPNDDLKGNDLFWRKMEIALPRLIEERRSQVFEVRAAPTERIEGLQEIGRR